MIAKKKTLRTLVVTRLSRDTEESTSIERQRQHLQQWAQLHGHEVIAVTEDVDVSGVVSPFERPELGPWLTPEKASACDALVALKVDRIARSLTGFSTLLDWCHERGKHVVAIEEGVDMSTPVGKMVAQILGIFAEFEREQIRSRVMDPLRHARVEGRWHGGMPPAGFMPVKLDAGKGWRLTVDHEYEPVMREIVESPRVRFRPQAGRCLGVRPVVHDRRGRHYGDDDSKTNPLPDTHAAPHDRRWTVRCHI